MPQSILDRLTDVAMPRLANERPSKEWMTVGGYVLPVHRARSARPWQRRGGAPRRGRAEAPRRGCHDREPERVRRHVGLLRIRQADATYRQHVPDAATISARWRMRLAAGGAMDEDTAYVEAVGSARALARFSLWVCLCRRTGSAAFCATRPITTKSGARQVAGRELLVSWFRS